MKNRKSLLLKLICLLLVSLVSGAALAEEIIDITDREVGAYWDFDRSQEGGAYPIDMGTILARHGGEIRWKYTYVIGKDGVARDFEFISAKPQSATNEVAQLKKVVLFHRYQRQPQSTYRGATRVHADLRWWKPDPKTVSFPAK